MGSARERWGCSEPVLGCLATLTTLASLALWVAYLILASSCSPASALLAPQPSEAHPRRGCYISCLEGYSFRRQHQCRGDRRRFLDISIVGRDTRRGVDGTILSDSWIARNGRYELTSYAVTDVELCDCDSYIRRVIMARDIEQRGVHPGERDYGKPPR